MKIIKIKTQEEFDALPPSFDKWTEIYLFGKITTNRARENSQVTAWENSQVTAWGNSQVTARENSQVTAWENSVQVNLSHASVLVCQACAPAIIDNGPKTQIIHVSRWEHDKASFLDFYPADADGCVTLYKVTTSEGYDHYTGKIKYEGEVICPDWDDNPQRQCGGGLHLSPESHLALGYNNGPVKTCKVHVDDFVVYPHDITKVRCRRVTVLS